MKLTSLKRKPKKKLRSKMAAPVSDVGLNEPDYPWGLELNFETETIKKLGIDVENSRVGDKIHFVAEGKITNLNQSESSEGKNEALGLQITAIGWGKPTS